MYSLTNLNLHDGSSYTIHVVGCNGAHLCTEAVSAPFLVSDVLVYGSVEYRLKNKFTFIDLL